MARLKYKIDKNEIREIDTKLGRVELNLSSSICFPHGIIGFDNFHYYCLCSIPEAKMPGALLLQSAEDDKVGFIVLPLLEKFYKEEGALINYSDIISAADSYDIKDENLTVLVIASLLKEDEKYKMTVNLKAPIFLDRLEKVAYQHVFVKHDYPLAYEPQI